MRNYQIGSHTYGLIYHFISRVERCHYETDIVAAVYLNSGIVPFLLQLRRSSTFYQFNYICQFHRQSSVSAKSSLILSILLKRIDFTGSSPSFSEVLPHAVLFSMTLSLLR